MASVFLFLLMIYPVCSFLHSTPLNLAKLNLTKLEVENRISEGYSVEIGRYPYATLLFFEAFKSSSTSCGGSLIMVQAVLTAASCVKEFRVGKDKISAFFGATVPKDSTAVRRVLDISINPRYQEPLVNNLAVVFLRKRVPLGHNIQKIPLANRYPQKYESLYGAGWGKQQVNRPYKLPDYSVLRGLRSAIQRIVPREDCKDYVHEKLLPSVLCTKSEQGYFRKDDAGDGLIEKEPHFMLMGVVSFADKTVTMSTYVFYHREWIINTCYELYIHNCKKGKMAARAHLIESPILASFERRRLAGVRNTMRRHVDA